MTTLLVQSCSQQKTTASGRIPAFERYDGYFFRIIKNTINGGIEKAPFDICILSAEHGLLNPTDYISNYDREMDERRAAELRDSVVTQLREKIQSSGYDPVVVNLGQVYYQAIQGFESGLGVTVKTIEGDGIGEKGQELKQHLESLLSETAEH
ncbi:DUF6884 domain-containing protein [Halosimplex halophilum]|uniref:DUF6884 domain-containing protein n=1 Tax=Halosimplex halophilum TaxID=2559572 RepID=UPI00107F0283|nr:DUF6884 domain-containing protein [Halosimplex halophilum]